MISTPLPYSKKDKSLTEPDFANKPQCKVEPDESIKTDSLLTEVYIDVAEETPPTQNVNQENTDSLKPQDMNWDSQTCSCVLSKHFEEQVYLKKEVLKDELFDSSRIQKPDAVHDLHDEIVSIKTEEIKLESEHSPQEIGQSSLQVDKELSQQEGPSRKHARCRPVFTKYQRQELEKLFENYSYPSTTQCQKYAKSLGLTHIQVIQWFGNRRKSFKKNCVDNGSIQNVGSSKKDAKLYSLKNRFPQYQKQELEKLFENDFYPSSTQYQECAKSLGLTYKQVITWFDRRRLRFKKNCVDNSCIQNVSSEKKDGLGNQKTNQNFRSPYKYTLNQKQELEKLFSNYHCPSPTQYQECAKSLGLTYQKVLIWFTNRRIKFRKMNCVDNDSIQSVGSSSLRLRCPLTLHQKQELEKLFESDHKPSTTQYQECAKSLGLTYQQVRQWFINRRYIFRKKNCVDNGSIQNVGSFEEKDTLGRQKNDQIFRSPYQYLTLNQKQELEKLFENDHQLPKTPYKEYAKALGLTYEQVRQWFNYRRRRLRKKNF